MPQQGPPCPTCGIKTTFVGVEQSIFHNAWIEAYVCPVHFHRFEAPIVRNKHDNDYKEPPYEGGDVTTV